jgi:hypothetical protein
MPILIIVFRAEKSRIMYQEVLEVYFKMTTLDLCPELFPGVGVRWRFFAMVEEGIFHSKISVSKFEV